MCNVRTITYSCGHTIPFRLSTCRGKFTYCTRKSPTGSSPSCRSAPLLTFVSQQPCGACAKAAEEKGLEEKIAKLRLEHISTTGEDDWASEPCTELVDAEIALDSSRWRLNAKYPEQARFKKDLRPEKGPFPTRSASLLSRSVSPSDVVMKADVNKTAALSGWDYESWGEGWTSLSEEIAGNDAERLAANLPAFTDCTFDCCEEREQGEQMPEEEVFAVMDWGVATTGVLQIGDEGWGGGAGSEEVVEGSTEERLGQDVKAGGIGKAEASENPGKTIEDQQPEPNTESTQPEPDIQSTQRSPIPQENEVPDRAKAPHRQRQRQRLSSTERSQQESFETCQAHIPFLNFAVLGLVHL